LLESAMRTMVVVVDDVVGQHVLEMTATEDVLTE
jgi:hypothetical protein